MAKVRKWLKKRRYQPTFSLEKIVAGEQSVTASGQFAAIDVPSHLAPYDENLLERARAQWKFGDWESLVRLDMNSIEHHPDRAKLGLVVASAWLQQGNSAAARRYLRHAMDWGCDKKLAAQILTAGVHNTLGRAAAINRDQARVEQHFRHAAVGSGSQIERASLSRRHVELNRLGLEQAALGGFEIEQSHTAANSCAPPYSILETEKEGFLSLAGIGIELSDIDFIKSRLPAQDFAGEQFDLDQNNITKNILVIFSTPRCGSTYLSSLLHVNGLCIPHEYFQLEQYLPILAQRWGCIYDFKVDIELYSQSLLKRRTDKNGWLGINLHSHHIKTFERFKKHFPGNVQFDYIHLVRKDTLAQAISYEIAEQTGQWTSFFKRITEPVYNFSSVSAKVKSINDGNFYIKSYIANSGIDCQEIYYEDLIIDSNSALSQLFPEFKFVNSKSPIEKQADYINSDWRLQFQSDLFAG